MGRGNPGFITQNNTIDLYQGGFDASWEIDLFGGNRRRVEASDAIISGNIAQYRDATISLVAEIVREYVTLREFQNRYAVIQEMAENQRRLMEFSRTKFANGAASTIEVSHAETVYKTMLASLPVFEREITAILYRISVLTGSENDEVVELLKYGKPIPETHAAPVMEAPAAVLSHRPDVTEAESYLMARTALTGVAISELYPKISIASLFGLQNTSLLPSQNIWNIGASVVLPLLNFGRIQGNIDAANAREQQAYHAYRKAVIEAVADIETKISDYAKNKEKTGTLSEALENSEKTLQSTRIRFEKGGVPLPVVLTAENNVLQTRDAYFSALAEEMKSIDALQKSIGM